MSLAESGPHKSKTKVSKSSYQLSVASQSPGPSPNVLRKDGLHPGKSHERSHSDTPPVPVGKWHYHAPHLKYCRIVILLCCVLPGLTAESSSVASLPGLRRGSVSSQESQEDKRQKKTGLELPPRAGQVAPPRPPDYQTTVHRHSHTPDTEHSRHHRHGRVARTQSRDQYSDDETQVSAV